MSGELLRMLQEGELANSGILQHLSELIRAQLENKSDLEGLNNVEIFSYYLRKNKFKFQEFLPEIELISKHRQPKQYTNYVTAVNQIKQKLAKIDDHLPYQRPDLVQEAQALKTAGISIGQTNFYHLKNVLKSLAIEQKTKSIRFWGKILGYKDYWVIQGSSAQEYISDLPENGQKYGNGVNTYSYWVSTDILGHWVELPLVTPEQVAGSRTFKYIFTGNPQCLVLKSQQFEGQQKHLLMQLKCIIARITHSCELAPKGLYKVGEENSNLIDFEDQFKLPEVAQLNSLDSWVHLNPNILNQGRCSHFIDPKLSQEQRQTVTAELAEKDPIIERLKGVSEDKPYEALGFTANWSVAIAGQTVPVNQIGKLEGTTLIYGVACLRNLVWPGATTVGFRGGWTNIYIGYGNRLSQTFNAIRELKDIQIEAEDKGERPQPNPSKAPVPVEQKKQEEPVPE